jgi:hypothetical protein
MINVYPTRIEAVDEDGDVLFVLSISEDRDCCTIHIKEPILLNNQNLEQVLTAVRRGVQMLGLED